MRRPRLVPFPSSVRRLATLSCAGLLAGGLLAVGPLLPVAASAQSALPRPAELPPAGGPGSAPARTAPAKPPAQQATPQKPAPAAQKPAAAAQPGPGPGQPAQPSPPRPYSSIAVTPPAQSADPSFSAFRQQLGEIAGRKDRVALAGLVAPGFFWLADRGDKADRKKAPIDNLARAIGLDGADADGWELLTHAAAEPTLKAFPPKTGVVCAPAAPTLDDKAFEQLLKSSRTDVFDWAWPATSSLPVRSGAAADAPVVETLGSVLVRVLPDEAPPGAPGAPGAQPAGGPAPAAGAPAVQPGPGAVPPLKVVTPSGKIGWVSADAVQPLVSDQLCYVKDASGWKIGGYLGGE